MGRWGGEMRWRVDMGRWVRGEIGRWLRGEMGWGDDKGRWGGEMGWGNVGHVEI